MASKPVKKVKPLSDYEAYNMAFMASEFKERHGSLIAEKARYQAKLELKARTEELVQKAKNSVESKQNMPEKNKKNMLTRKLRTLHGNLRNQREYAIHIDHNTGDVTRVLEPSYTNIVVRATRVKEFNDAKKKDFEQSPKATLLHKSANGPPAKWAMGDPVTTPEYPIHTALLAGKPGSWKRDPDFLHADTDVIYKQNIIVGVFKEYSPAMFQHYPDLIYCSERFWIENGVLRDI